MWRCARYMRHNATEKAGWRGAWLRFPKLELAEGTRWRKTIPTRRLDRLEVVTGA